jgi:sRNA-binding protein
VDLDKDDEIIALLAERWPRCFMLAEDRRLPLKVGIFHDLNRGEQPKPPNLNTRGQSENVCVSSTPQLERE